MSKKKRSPIKDRPLRNPGQSVQEHLFDLFTDKFVLPWLIAFVLVAFAIGEWLRYFNPQPPAPRFVTFLAFLGLAYAAYTLWKYWRPLQALRLARDGEKAVGQFLELLREGGYRVFHDVLGTGFNVDHVIVGPAGVFTIETKTFSKRSGRDLKVQFDGERILVDGFEPDRDAVIQAKAQARWLRQLLEESAGKKFAVRPVVLFPGWWVEQSSGSTRDLWVLEPTALPGFLAHEPEILAPDDIKLASYHLSRFIRTS